MVFYSRNTCLKHNTNENTYFDCGSSSWQYAMTCGSVPMLNKGKSTRYIGNGMKTLGNFWDTCCWKYVAPGIDNMLPSVCERAQQHKCMQCCRQHVAHIQMKLSSFMSKHVSSNMLLGTFQHTQLVAGDMFPAHSLLSQMLPET